MPKPFYITTPIYYVNDVPHIGHAYTTIAADVLARYRRLMGSEVFFLTGLDEHGQKVQQAAQKAGIEPQRYCDQLAPQFQNLWQRLNISYDDFVRTTQPRHTTVVQKILQALYEKQEIYQADYTGWYCTFDERFWTEKDVVDGLCPDCKRPVERLSEKNYFFRMGNYRDRLIRHMESHPDFILPQSRRNEVLGFLQQPLEDLSISRPKSRLSWGIELPFDKEYVAYVWFDALVNYISIPGYLSDETRFHTWWPADVHLIGKDILTTHSVYWSTMLMALGLDLPRTVFAHGWWTVNGEKMSKSRGNVVDPNAMIEEFGVDAFRYFLMREVPFGQDGDFSREAFITRVNTDLANDLGNLLSRTLTMIERFSNGKIPASSGEYGDRGPWFRGTVGDDEFKNLQDYLDPSTLRVTLALEEIWRFIRQGNQYIEVKAPWTLAKNPDDKPKLDAVLFHLAGLLRWLSRILYPFMPATAKEIARQLGLNWEDHDFANADPFNLNDLSGSDDLPGRAISRGQPLFPRIEAKQQKETRVSEQQMTTPSVSTSANVPPAISQPPEITIDEFQKVQLKVATVLSAERVPRSEKLLKLRVDLG
ncbi:MAG: methionine--tRNA ligase, partial [Nitrospiraceae bacterium]|nr:methionine--tRNA ligase [Nitrospiraceae bacterium]